MFNPNPGSYPNYNQMQPQYPQFGRGLRGPAPNYNQFVPSTNKQFVRSLEEALSLPADFNSQNVYFDVNKNVMYDICTNGNGEKSWSILNISLAQTSNVNATSVAVGDMADPFEKRFKAIENKLEELINGKHNVEQTNTTNE
jgi:hypothetical protein